MWYKIVTADNTIILEQKVHESIKDGWMPQGGVAIHEPYGKYSCVAQAMVKPEHKKDGGK